MAGNGRLLLMINYENIYSQMSDEELFRLAEQQSSLVDEAREAVCAEVQKRGGVAAILARVKEPQKIPERKTVEYAGFWRRWFAQWIDSIILSIILLSVEFFADPDAEGPLAWTLGLVALAVWVLYFAWPYSAHGQTPGKKLLGIRVVTLDGSRLNWRTGIVRTFGYSLSALPLGLGYLWAIWDPDKQTWHDKVAGTTVVEDWVEEPAAIISPAEAQRRRRRWELGFGVSFLLLSGVFILPNVWLTEQLDEELTETDEWAARVNWPTRELPIEKVGTLDLSQLGIKEWDVKNARDEGKAGLYKEGVVVTYYKEGEIVLRLWVMNYDNAKTTAYDFASLYPGTGALDDYLLKTGNCPIALWEPLGEVIAERNCHYNLLSDHYWIVEILAFEGENSPTPSDLVSAVRDALEVHWTEMSKQ